MADGPRAKFNNAAQRLFGATMRPVVYVWKTNDPVSAWYAEARPLKGEDLTVKFPQVSATRRQTAKDLAARMAYQWLVAQYPNPRLI